MNKIHLRVDVRMPQDLYDFLVEQSGLKKLSFEGLILLYLRERMEAERRSATGGLD